MVSHAIHGAGMVAARIFYARSRSDSRAEEQRGTLRRSVSRRRSIFRQKYVDRMRRAVQIHTMRQALYLADLAVLTIPAEIIPWVPPSAQNIVFIPVGANLPSPEIPWKQGKDHGTDSPAVAIFSL